MSAKDIKLDILKQSEYRLERSFNSLIGLNPRYKNLDREDREILLALIKKYKDKIRRKAYPSASTVRRDTYYLHKNRLKLGLSSTDIDQIRDILNNFTKP